MCKRVPIACVVLILLASPMLGQAEVVAIKRSPGLTIQAGLDPTFANAIADGSLSLFTDDSTGLDLVDDAWLYGAGSSRYKNYGESVSVAVNNAVILTRFDLSPLPNFAGSRILKAELRFYYSAAVLNNGIIDSAIGYVTFSPWAEGNKDGIYPGLDPAAPGVCAAHPNGTYKTGSGTMGWANATQFGPLKDGYAMGCPRITASYPEILPDGTNPSNDGFTVFDVTTIVQAWADGTPNYGFYFSQAERNCNFRFSETPLGLDFIPTLFIEYAPKTVPPASISDLAVAETKTTRLKLTWTATGDDGSTGQAAFYDLRYSTAPISDANFSAATAVAGVPQPKPAGSVETFTVSGLQPGTTYYFALKVIDPLSNVSALSNVLTAATAPVDLSPPAAITSLTVADVEPTAVTLQWLVPADVGDEGVSGYDLRYSTAVISEGNFETATQVAGVPRAQPSGMPQTFRVTGLSPDTQYYFALKSFDRAQPANVSAISNVASIRTPAPVIHSIASVPEFMAALDAAEPGDEIRIAYGVYPVLPEHDCKHWFKKSGTAAQPIRIIGQLGPNGERPVFDANGTNIDRGIFYFWSYIKHYVIENLEFRNARGWAPNSPNAAAAYIYGDDITFRNCYSHHNDNGFSSASAMVGTAVFENCEVSYNGKITSGDDQTHNFYMGGGDLVIVRNCHIHHSLDGQNFKSRSKSVRFEYNYVHDDANYCWELATGNSLNSIVIGNVFVKSPSAASHKFIGLGDGIAVTSGTLTLVNNVFVSTNWQHIFFGPHSSSTCSIRMYNNVFCGPSKILNTVAIPMTGSHNWFNGGTDVPAGVTDSVFGQFDPGFVNAAAGDYRLMANSPCRDAGTNGCQYFTPQMTWQGILPEFQPVPPRAAALRLDDGLLDMGAFESEGVLPPIGQPIAADFNDGTMGDLDVVVPVSYREAPISVTVTTQSNGLPDFDNELYIEAADKQPGLDCAVLDNGSFFGDVTVSAVVGIGGGTMGIDSGGAGVIAGSLPGRGCGYMLYIVRDWGDSGTTNGNGKFYSHLVGPLGRWQLILVRNDPGLPGYPLEGKQFVGARLDNFLPDTPNYLRLTVQGNQVLGELWLNSSLPVGSPTCTVSLTDPAPLAGYTGVYLCARKAGLTAGAQVAVDDFQAVSLAPVNRTLTVSVAGEGGVTPNGRVDLDPPGGSYPAGTTVQLTAVPTDSAWQFLRWEGGLSGSANPASLVLNDDTAVTAVFGKIGDIDGDGAVNVFDIFVIAEAWNTQVGDPLFNPAADLDGDGFINVFDIFVIAEHWNT